MLEGLLASLFDSPVSIPIVAICVAIGVPVVAHYWFALRRHEMDTELKRSMVERGMSAEEIERVLAAKSAGDEEDEEDEE
jgi:hypothetical protein